MVPNLSLLHARCSICCIVLSRILLSVMLPPRYPTSDSDHVHHAPLSGNATGAGGIWEDPTWSDLYRFIGHSHPVDLFARCSNKQRSIHKSGAWGKECCSYCILCRNQKVNFHTHSQLFNKSLQVREITNFSKELNGSPHNVSWLMGENPLPCLAWECCFRFRGTSTNCIRATKKQMLDNHMQRIRQNRKPTA